MKRAILILSAAVALTSCVHDELYYTNHPDTGVLKVTTDWESRAEAADIPAEYTLLMGDGSVNTTTLTTEWPVQLAQGDYSILAYNTPAHINIIGETADWDGSEPIPGYCFSRQESFFVAKDDTTRVTMPMVQRNRDLRLIVKLDPRDDERYVSAEAMVSGLAGQCNLITGQLSGIVATSPAVTLSTCDGLPALVMDLRPFGVAAGEACALSLTVNTVTGDIYSITTALTDQLQDFTSSDLDTLVLVASLTMPFTPNLQATINDWQVGGNHTGDAED